MDPIKPSENKDIGNIIDCAECDHQDEYCRCNVRRDVYSIDDNPHNT
jgi:hypothetical protein